MANIRVGDSVSTPSGGPAYPYPPDNQTSTQPNRFPFTAAGGFLAALLLVVVGVGVYFGVRALAGGDKDEPFDLVGTVALRTDSLTTSGLPAGFECAGRGDYSDIGPGAAVTVSDETGTLLAKGTLASSIGDNKLCVFTFNVPDVPAGAKFYQVQVSNRDATSYTEQEARGHVEVSLGEAPADDRKTSVPAPPPPPPPATQAQPPATQARPPSRPVPADPRPDWVPEYSTVCTPGIAVGSSKTSCAFARNVRDAYVANGWGIDAVLVVHSPVTGKMYEMTCTGLAVVTCRGGDNAVVYLY